MIGFVLHSSGKSVLYIVLRYLCVVAVYHKNVMHIHSLAM